MALHASQVTGHVRIMNSGLVLHSPAAPHAAHSLLPSLHSGVHRPQLVGQIRSIASGLASHSPAVAQAPQDTSVSLHECVQMPHDRGHSIAMNFCQQSRRQLWEEYGLSALVQMQFLAPEQQGRVSHLMWGGNRAHRVVPSAFPIASPVGAVRALVVADARRHGAEG